MSPWGYIPFLRKGFSQTLFKKLLTINLKELKFFGKFETLFFKKGFQ
jgi:hypothetical protein